jgi:hypothetical protein
MNRITGMTKSDVPGVGKRKPSSRFRESVCLAVPHLSSIRNGEIANAPRLSEDTGLVGGGDMTTLRHHPHDETLMSFAAGVLDPAMSLVRSCHL